MRRAPFVPTQLEEAIFQLAGQYPQKVRLNIVSERDQLHILVLVQFGQVLLWNVHDYLYGIERMAERLDGVQRMLGPQTILLFAWEADASRLAKQKLPGDAGATPATEGSSRTSLVPASAAGGGAARL